MQPVAEDSVFDDVDTAADAELAHGVGLMSLDGLYTEVEPRRDLLVAVAE